MADPTKILAYATQRRDSAKQAVTALQQQLVKAQAGFAASSGEVASAAVELAELEKGAAEIRKKLSEIITPADGAALLDELEQVIIRARAARAAALRAQGESLAAQAAASLAEDGLAAGAALLASAEAQLKKAEQSNKQREAWKKSLTTLPLSKLNTDADSALKNKPFTDAQARVAADIPAKLLARAEERRAAEAARINRRSADTQAAEAAASTERDKNGGLAGPADNSLAAFLRLEAAARNFVNTAKVSFDRAQATLAQVADPARSPLTPEQTARITDASLKADREAAAAEEKALADKLKDWEDKQAILDAEVLKAKAAGKDPDKEQKVKDAKKDVGDAETAFKILDDAWRAKERGRDAALTNVEAKQGALSQAIKKAIAAKKNPDTDPDVMAAKSDLAKAESDFKKAEDDYQASSRGILDAWEAAVPDSAWRIFDDYEEAAAALTLLKDADPAKLKNDLQKAEEDYVKAQLAADKGANVLALLAAEQAERAAREQSARSLAAARLFSALRGDN
jgi:hypothetical protein